MKTKPLCLLVGAWMAVADPASAQQLDLEGRTQIGFETSLFGLFTLAGTFSRVTGSIDLGGPHPGDEVIDVTIDAAAIEAESPQVAARLRGPDFFDAQTYPTITFRSTHVAATEPGRLAIDGDLTIRGVTRRQRLDATYAAIHAPNGQTSALASVLAVARLSRKDFGMTALPAIIGDTVTITVRITDLAPR